MLTDRTYLLFRPRTTLPNERLTIRSESGSGPMSTSSFGRLSHSSSFDRLPLSGTTSSIGPSGWINGHLSPSSTFGYRRSEYRSITPASPRLARRTMTFSSADLRSPSTMITSTSSSPNMEKREALMSSFARHTNSARTRPTLTTYHASPASTSPLPPRPKHSSFLAQNRSTNTMRSSPYISSSASNVLSSPSSSSSSLLRAHLQEYFRPTIRQRPQFSAIRKSVMQRSRPMYDTNRSRLNGTGYTSPSLANFSANSSISNNYSHHHNLHTHHHNSHCNGAMALRGSSSFASTSTSNGGSRRDSLMSAGSSLSRSSSSGSGCNLLNLADNSGIATVSAASNPSAASGESTPIELRGRSVRKVYRYRSVIKFQEHNIGQSLDERRQHINWDLESGLSNDLNGIGSSTAIDSVGLPTSHQTATASSSSATLSDCCTDFSFKSAVPALPNQLSKRTKSMPRKSVDDIKRHTWPQPKVNAFPYSNRLYVSEPNVNVKRISAALKKSDVEMLDDKLSVKMNESDSIETMTEPETVGEAIGNKSMRNKMEVKVKQILKSAGKAFTRKKTLSNDSSEASNESNKKAETSKRKAKTKVPRLVAKTDLKLESVKGEYVKATCLKEKTTESNQSTIQMDLPIISSHFNCIDWIEKQKIETICCSSDLLQTEFQSPEPVTFKVKLEQPLFCGSFVRPEVKIEIVRLDQPTMKSAYVPFPVQTVKSEWTCQLGDYHRPETIREITSIRLEALRTEFAYPDCVWSKTVWSPITTDLEFAFVSGSAQIERSNSSMKSHSASIGHVRTSIRNWPANRTSFQAPPLKLNSRLSNKPQSLESKACQQIPSIASTSTSIESSKACTSLVTDKPPKSKKKLKQNENRQAEPLSTCSIDFASQVAVSLSNSESSSNNERQSSHSKSTNMMLPLTRSPLQECNQQARSDRLIATARPIKSKRIQFRKYFVDDFVFRSVLGRGSFGKVFLAELIGHDQYFAIKCLKKNVVIEDNDVESTMIERKVLALGSANSFICKLFCTFQTASYLCFAMEFVAGGDLMFHVQKVGRFDENRARFYAAEIVCALNFLHRRFIIYRDLKLDNILLDRDGHIRLVDFGMCQCKTYRQECLPSNFCGTPDYMAPEIIKGIKYNHAVDWWSFGVLLYEMLIGKSPFSGADEDELLWNVCNESVIFPLFLSKESVQIITQLLNRNPDRRLGMPNCSSGDVTVQPFFNGINWQHADLKQLKPPFKPDLKSADDISNFDKEFTEAEPALTPIDENITSTLDHQLFDGFSYTNPNMTD